VFKQFGLGAEAVGGFLMVAPSPASSRPGFLNNGGGAWDNAKKYIETGATAASAPTRTRPRWWATRSGDPFKDTAGPSLHVLIKLLATITLVMRAAVHLIPPPRMNSLFARKAHLRAARRGGESTACTARSARATSSCSPSAR
jgi:hypothetical protein